MQMFRKILKITLYISTETNNISIGKIRIAFVGHGLTPCRYSSIGYEINDGASPFGMDSIGIKFNHDWIPVSYTNHIVWLWLWWTFVGHGLSKYENIDALALCYLSCFDLFYCKMIDARSVKSTYFFMCWPYIVKWLA